MSEEGTEQIPMLAIAVSGLRDLEGWSTDKTAADFFDVKGTLEGLLANLGDRLTFEASVFPGLHDGQSAAILVQRAFTTWCHLSRFRYANRDAISQLILWMFALGQETTKAYCRQT